VDASRLAPGATQGAHHEGVSCRSETQSGNPRKDIAELGVGAAIIGAAVVYLAMASHVRGAAIPIEQIRSTRDIPNMPASMGAAHWGADPGSAGPLAAWPVFRFDFLEFEADPDAPVE
jgi:hypothetical protein